jgi:ABC-type uncharacterized transport system involved in gliding motility auxiliary subunit
VLAEVKEPLGIEYYYQRDQHVRVRDLLALLRDHCPELKTELVDIDRNPQRAKDHNITRADRAVLSYQGRRMVVPAGNEMSLISGIARIVSEKAKVLYFLTDHRERSVGMGKPDQLGRAGQVLREEGYTLRSLSLLRAHSVPEEASAVVIAGPEVDLVDEEIAELDRYLAGGGSVLVLVDPLELPNVERWVASHGLGLADDVVIDRANRVYGSDGTNVIVPGYRDHPMTQALDVPTVLGRARSVSVPSGEREDSPARIVARSAEGSFLARGAARSRQGEVVFQDGTDQPGPIGVMGVTLVGSHAGGGGGDEKEGRLVVIGDADFASDSYLTLLGNRDLLVTSIDWLVARKTRGTRGPSETADLGPLSPVFVSERLSQLIFTLSVIVEPLLFLVAGIVVVWLRRRRR